MRVDVVRRIRLVVLDLEAALVEQLPRTTRERDVHDGITPAVGESEGAVPGLDGVGPVLKTTGLGVVKLVWLRTLKYSMRNCVRTLS